MSESHDAYGHRRGGRVTVEADDGPIPALDQWVRDYVDRRAVTDGTHVLRAYVADAGVTRLIINAHCASAHAERMAQAENEIELTDDFQ